MRSALLCNNMKFYLVSTGCRNAFKKNSYQICIGHFIHVGIQRIYVILKKNNRQSYIMIYNRIHKLKSSRLKETQREYVFNQVKHPLISVINKNYK